MEVGKNDMASVSVDLLGSFEPVWLTNDRDGGSTQRTSVASLPVQ
jgi:hypothetical protein